MASLYKRGGKWWLRYKKDGQWKGAPTGFRVDNNFDTANARRLCRQRTKEEEIASSDHGDSRWECWVLKWIDLKWGHLKNSTPGLYKRHWGHLSDWLKEIGVDRPGRLTREHCQGYLQWRAAHNGGRNTAIHELKLLGQVLDESVRRKILDTNPARKLGIRSEKAQHKDCWTDQQISAVGQELEEHHWGSWLHVTFLMGLYQAARLSQAELPLQCFDFTHNVIYYPMERVKGGKFFAQPMDVRLRDTLFQCCSERAKHGEQLICKIPEFPSVHWRSFLDKFGFSNISHHGLRVTWATKACLAGVPISQAMAFCNHSSEVVHRVYQQLSVGDLAGVPQKIAFPSFSLKS